MEKQPIGRPPKGEAKKVPRTYRLDPDLVARAEAVLARIPRGDDWTMTRVVENGVELILKMLESKYPAE